MAHQALAKKPLNRKQPLGKGLSALLGPDPEVPETALREVSIDRLLPGKYQPRKKMDQDALQELADSIKENGMVQPIVVRDFGDQFEIIAVNAAGERRSYPSSKWSLSLSGISAISNLLRLALLKYSA